MMKISNEMIEQIKKFEGCSLKAYLDSKGVVTIGIGHTGKDVTMGDVISTEECNRLFREDIKSAEKQVNDLNNELMNRSKYSVQMSQCQFDALVDLVYNAGGATIKNGNTMRNVLMNNGLFDYSRICHAFMLWVKITNPKTGKKEVLGGSDGKHGLVLRRAIECAWYCMGANWEKECESRKIVDVVEWAKS